MAINDINNPAIVSSAIDGLHSTATDTHGLSNSIQSKNLDWFSNGDGKALPISAQSQFGDTATIDDMVNAIVTHLGL